jgi:protein-S-isoprenylcysteine O-methyltransferase Ste14
VTAVFVFASTLGFLELAALGWGGWGALLAHPARAGAVLLSLALAGATAASGMSLGPGRREGAESAGFFPAAIVGTLLLAWLPPYMDRHDLWTVDGDRARWLGLALLVVGGVLRVWPILVLGWRFSPFVAIQERHELVTGGIYRVIRHPSYVGAVLGLAAWSLVFRSSVGLAMIVPTVWMVVARIEAEEALLASEFGERYEAYRRRTWRLVPFVY